MRCVNRMTVTKRDIRSTEDYLAVLITNVLIRFTGKCQRDICLLSQEIATQASALGTLVQASLVNHSTLRGATCSSARNGFGTLGLVQLADPVVVSGAGVGRVRGRDDDTGSSWDEGLGSRDGEGLGAVLHDGSDVVRPSAVARSASVDIKVANRVAAACR